MVDVNKILKEVELFEKLAKYGDRKSFLKALAQEKSEDYFKFEPVQSIPEKAKEEPSSFLKEKSDQFDPYKSKKEELEQKYLQLEQPAKQLPQIILPEVNISSTPKVAPTAPTNSIEKQFLDSFNEVKSDLNKGSASMDDVKKLEYLFNKLHSEQLGSAQTISQMISTPKLLQDAKSKPIA